MDGRGRHRAGASPKAQASLQTRIASAALVTTLVVLLAACVSFIAAQWAEARNSAQNAQTTLAQSIAAGFAPSIAAGSTSESLRTAFVRVMDSADVHSARMVGKDGEVFAEFKQAPAPGAGSGRYSKPTIAPIVMNGRKVGELTVVAEAPKLHAILVRGVCCVAPSSWLPPVLPCSLGAAWPERLWSRSSA